VRLLNVALHTLFSWFPSRTSTNILYSLSTRMDVEIVGVAIFIKGTGNSDETTLSGLERTYSLNALTVHLQ